MTKNNLFHKQRLDIGQILSATTGFVFLVGVCLLIVNFIFPILGSTRLLCAEIICVLSVFFCACSVVVNHEEYQKIDMPKYIRIWITYIYPCIFFVSVIALLCLNIIFEIEETFTFNTFIIAVAVAAFVYESYVQTKYVPDVF